MKKNLVVMMILYLSLLLNACGSSSPEKGDPPELPSATKSEKVFIEAGEGGDVVCKGNNDVIATLTIPPNALKKSMDVTLNVAPADEALDSGLDTLYQVTIDPQDLLLNEPAVLKVQPVAGQDDYGETGLFSLNNDGPVPLKQSREAVTVKGNVYRFGSYDVARYDLTDCNSITMKMFEADTPDTWQDLLTVFNGMIWAGNYYQDIGKTDDALECFQEVSVICSNGIDQFLEKIPPEAGSELADYKKALEKYKYIQKLSADQEILEKNLDKN